MTDVIKYSRGKHPNSHKAKKGGRPKGFKVTDETKRKIGKSNSISLLGHIPWNKGKKTGVKPWNYKGDNYKSKNRRLRSHPNWKYWRVKVFIRDDFTCQKCNIKGLYLEAHHLIPVKECLLKNNLELIYDINNGITLCRKCHMKVHKWKINIKGE